MRGGSAAKRDLDLPQAARVARALIRLRHLLPHTGEGQCLGRRGRRPTGGMILPPRTCLSAARLPVGCAPRRRYPAPAHVTGPRMQRSEEHTSELQSLMRTSYAVFCLKKNITSELQLIKLLPCTIFIDTRQTPDI